MSAIDDLLAQASLLEKSVDQLTTAGFAPSVEGHLARGIAVQGFASVEQFLLARADEWQSMLTSYRLAPNHLPDGGMIFGNRLVEVFPRALRDEPSASRPALLNGVAQSLMTLSTGTWTAHATAFRWSGSNAQVSDVTATLMILGYEQDKAWSALTQIWQKVDPRYPQNSSAAKLFEAISGLRHEAAHAAVPLLPIQSLLALPSQVRMLCVCIDVAASWALQHLRTHPVGSGSSKPPSVSTLAIRLIEEQSDGRWSEFGPRARAAYRRHPDLVTAVREARGRAVRPTTPELVVARTTGGEVADWVFPL